MRAKWVSMIVAAALFGACGDDDGALSDGGNDASADARVLCDDAADCDDGVYCNGEERCEPGSAGADARGCHAGAAPCSAEVACDEASRACVSPCANLDADGDGHTAIECGGDDCDDTDPNRYPDAFEICNGHDDDCDGIVDEECEDLEALESGVFVIDVLQVPTEESTGVAEGFDLDGRVSDEFDAASCFHADLTAPDGTPGIDNHLAHVAPTLSLVGDPHETIARNILSGAMVWVVELEAVESGVRVQLRRGLVPGGGAPLSSEGRLTEGQVFDYEASPPVVSMMGVRRGNTIFAEELTGQLVFSWGADEDFVPMPLRGIRFRANLGAGGTLTRGLLGGHLLGEDLIATFLAQSGGGIDEATIRAAVGSWTDMLRSAETDECEALSAGFTFSAISAVLGAER